MRTVMGAGLIGAAAACAHAQYLEVLIEDSASYEYFVGETLEYSVWLRDGDQITGFAGWAGFEGRILGPGLHNTPAELGTDGADPDTGWEGRRPPSSSTFPGGSGGGFRYNAQTYTPIFNGLEGVPGQPFRGEAASVAQGGFLWDGSTDLEVFRGSFVANTADTYQLDFDLNQVWYFPEGFFSPIALTDPLFQTVSATYFWTPTPASIVMLGCGLLVARRRR